MFLIVKKCMNIFYVESLGRFSIVDGIVVFFKLFRLVIK